MLLGLHTMVKSIRQLVGAEEAVGAFKQTVGSAIGFEMDPV